MGLINLGASGSSSTLISYQTCSPAAHPILLGVESPPAHSLLPLRKAYPSGIVLVGKIERGNPVTGPNREASDALWWVGSVEGVLPSVSPAGTSQFSPEELETKRISQMQDS